MKIKVLRYWEMFKTNFWFIPLLIIFIALLLATGLIYIDHHLAIPEFEMINIFISGGPQGARTILSTIAGSMMTVAGIVFSITLVALTLASSQFGPRLLRNYMKNRLNQTVLGVYVATFIYCLIVLGAIEPEKTAPQLSMLVAVMAAVANIFLLIIFIHHIATSIQAEHVIAEVSKELNSSLRSFFPEQSKNLSPEYDILESEITKTKNHFPSEEVIKTWKSGYLQALDEEKLLSIAEKHDLLLEYQYRPGGFAIKGIELVKIYHKELLEEEVLEEIRSCFIFGSQRSPAQDPEYAIHQLVEIASRALSPGINDPNTAISCADKLGAAIGYLTERKFPDKYRFNKENELRIIANPIVFKGIVEAAFNQIRQYGRGNASVLIHLLDIILSLSELVKNERQANVLLEHADMIMKAGTESLHESKDINDLNIRHKKIKAILKSGSEAAGSTSALDFA